MSFQHTRPSGPGMLESLKEIAVAWKHRDVKKPECPVLCTGMNSLRGFEGMCPQFNLAFSLEESRTFGRDSSPK